MSKTFIAKIINISVVLLFCSVSIAASDRQPQKIPGWYLIWQDEFEGESLDLAKWKIEDAALIKNNELQYYTTGDVYLHDGILTLRSQKRPMDGREYTSGLVETKGKFSQQYGRFEIRAKLPKGKGIWPAYWLLPADGRWPPEIDIIELIGHSPHTIYMTLHWGVWPEHKQSGGIYTGADFSEDFHIFAVEWEPREIRWYIDGIQRFSINHHIPQEPFYLILNTAVGGNWSGNPNSLTVFPQYHSIDYVRVYAKEIPGTCFLTTAAINGRIVITPTKPRYEADSEVTLQAVPSIGYEFSHWSGDLSSDKNPVIISMNQHKRINANFIKSIYTPQLLSQGKPATASSLETENLSAANAVDENLSTRWSSEFSDPQWIHIDLGKVYQIEAVRLCWENAYAKAYEIQISNDGYAWKTVYSTTIGRGQKEEITGLNVPARYVSMYGTERGTQSGYSLWEFEVYGREDQSPN